MDIVIDPAQTVKNYCSSVNGGCGIQEINDKCFSVASAYSNDVDAWSVPTEYSDKCNDLATKSQTPSTPATK